MIPKESKDLGSIDHEDIPDILQLAHPLPSCTHGRFSGTADIFPSMRISDLASAGSQSHHVTQEPGSYLSRSLGLAAPGLTVACRSISLGLPSVVEFLKN